MAQFALEAQPVSFFGFYVSSDLPAVGEVNVQNDVVQLAAFGANALEVQIETVLRLQGKTVFFVDATPAEPAAGLFAEF